MYFKIRSQYLKKKRNLKVNMDRGIIANVLVKDHGTIREELRYYIN